MEELFSHFISHIHNNISPELSKQLFQIVNQSSQSSSYDEIVLQIKHCIKDYLHKASSNETDKTKLAKALYYGFIQADDANIIRNLKLLYRYYSFYHQLRLKGYLFKWRRINAIEHKRLYKRALDYKEINNTNNTDTNTFLCHKSKDKINTIHNTIKNYTKPIQNTTKSSINHYIQNHYHEHLPEPYTISNIQQQQQQQKQIDNGIIINSTGHNYNHNNLYSDHHKRTYHSNFTNELKDVTQVAQCTFVPNSNYSL